MAYFIVFCYYKNDDEYPAKEAKRKTLKGFLVGQVKENVGLKIK